MHKKYRITVSKPDKDGTPKWTHEYIAWVDNDENKSGYRLATIARLSDMRKEERVIVLPVHDVKTFPESDDEVAALESVIRGLPSSYESDDVEINITEIELIQESD